MCRESGGDETLQSLPAPRTLGSNLMIALNDSTAFTRASRHVENSIDCDRTHAKRLLING